MSPVSPVFHTSISHCILTTWELSMNRKHLQAPTLAGTPWANQGPRPHNYTTPGQSAVYVILEKLVHYIPIFRWIIMIAQ